MANKKHSNTKTKKGSSRAVKNKRNLKQKDWYLIHIIALIILSVLLSIFVYVDTGSGGVINQAVKNLLFGLFGWTGYLIPISFVGYLIYLVLNRDVKRLWIKIALTTLSLTTLSSIIALSARYDEPSDAMYEGANNMCGGGYIGALIGGGVENLVQIVLAYILLVAVLIVLISAVTDFPLFSCIRKGINILSGQARYKYENTEFSVDDFKRRLVLKGKRDESEDEEYAEPKRKRIVRIEKTEVREAPNFADPVEEMDFETGIDEVFGTSIEPDANNVTLVDKSTKTHTINHGNTEDFSEDTIEDTFKDTAEETFKDISEKEIEEKTTEVTKNSDSDETVAGETEIKQKRETRDRVEKISSEEKKTFSEELNSALEQEMAFEYEFPSTKLLDLAKKTGSDQRLEMRQTAERLISILATFGVKAKLLQVTQGPAVTRYEIQPDTGTKLSKITGLAEDIALNLAVSTVLVAPVPGKVAVGIEIPNNTVSSVTARELLESSEFKNSKSRLTVALGKDIGGNVVLGNIAKWPHVLIAGQTGSGKSVCINTIIMSILYNASPEDVRLIMIDPKVVELGVYNGIPHLLIPVVTEPKKAAGALNWAVSEMMRRYELFKNTGVRKLECYNALMDETGGKKEPQLVIIIDELADLMMVAAKEVEDYICRLAQLARAAGIHLIIATQRPSVDVITGLIKANVPSRIAFSVASQIDSRTILDRGGAEKLLGMGDMLYYPTGARAAVRVQGAFVSDDEIERVLSFIKNSVGETHYSEDLAEQIERYSTGENGVTPDVQEDGDPLLQDAIQLAVELGKISTSMVQRRLGVGYSRAGRLIDQMEARGIISGANGSKPRDVLVSHADMVSIENSETEITEE